MASGTLVVEEFADLGTPLVIDCSDLTGQATLVVRSIHRSTNSGDPAVPAAGRRVGSAIVIQCPAKRGARLAIDISDIDVDAVTLRRTFGRDERFDDATSITEVLVRDAVVGAFEAVGLRAEDVTLSGLRCARRVVLSEARILGALEVGHAEIGGTLKLPSRAGRVWIYRCSTEGVECSGSKFDEVVLDRAEVTGLAGIQIRGTLARRGLSIVNSQVAGSVTIAECTVLSLSLEDSIFQSSISLQIACVDESDDDPRSITIPVNVSGARVGGAFLARAVADPARAPHTTGLPPATGRLALWAGSTEFLGPVRAELGDCSGIPNSKFHAGATIKLKSRTRLDHRLSLANAVHHEEVTTLDMTSVWSAKDSLTVTGHYGNESLSYLDHCVAPLMQLSKVDLSRCRLAQLQVQDLRLASDVRFYRRTTGVRTFPGVHRYAPEVADEAMGAVDPTTLTWTAAKNFANVPWTFPLVRRIPPTPPMSAERPTWQEFEVAKRDRDLAEALARVYLALSTAFDRQGDSATSEDFYWQRHRWRRIYGSRTKQVQRRDKYARKLIRLDARRHRLRGSIRSDQGPPSQTRVPIWSRRLVRCRLFSWGWARFGGIDRWWVLLHAHQTFLGSNVRARTPLLWWTLLLVLATLVIQVAVLAPSRYVENYALPTLQRQGSELSIHTREAVPNVESDRWAMRLEQSLGLATEMALPVPTRPDDELLVSRLGTSSYWIGKFGSSILFGAFGFSISNKLRRSKVKD